MVSEMETGAPDPKKPKLIEGSCDRDVASSQQQQVNDIGSDIKQQVANTDAANFTATNSADMKTALDVRNVSKQKVENKTTLTNGSGQKLESIIGRLCSDRSTLNSFENHDEKNVVHRMEASTQTFPDFVRIVKGLVFRRMKQLELSLIGGAVADSVLNGKLAELHKENKELREKTKILQDKVDRLLNVQKDEDNVHVVKDTEIPNSMPLQAVAAESRSISPHTRQAAVVNPYNVQDRQQDLHPQMARHIVRTRTDIPEVQTRTTISQGPTHLSSKNVNSSFSNVTSQSPSPRQGPQVKYVPHKLPANQGLPGGPNTPYVQLGQEGVVMQRLPPQHPQSSGGDHRIPGQQIVYTNPPIQVTGPRMSTLPPQPVKQHHGMQQRPMLSPSSSGIRLAQPAVAPGSSVRIQVPAGQTVHYVPQGVMPAYLTQVQPNFSRDTHRIIQQGPNNQDFRAQAPAAQNVVHGGNDFRVRQNHQPPPPYQTVPRSQVEPVTPPKLQVNITVSGNGIVLSWDFEHEPPANTPVIECYHLFASQDSPNPPTSRSEWKKIGVVKALPLPMACTLTQFVSGNSYHFAVIAIDVHGREGQMSNPCTVRLNK